MTVPPSRFDRAFVIINRSVSVLLLLALLGMLAGACVLAYISSSSGPVKEPGMAKVEEKSADASKAVLLGFGNAEQVRHADVDMIRLVVEGRAPSYPSAPQGDTRNVLFVRGGGQPAHWLFKDHRNAVTVLEQLHEAGGDRGHAREDARTLALYIEFRAVTPGTEGGSRAGRVLTVALARPDGTALTGVLKDVTRVLSHRVVDGRRLGMLFQRGTVVWQATVSLDDFTVTGEREIARLPAAI
jgi:hypothetical protein